jgi:HSP20 family molecular chaperone IbpA
MKILMIFFLLSPVAFAQTGNHDRASEEQRMLRYKQLMDEAHKRLRDSLIHGFGDDDDIFKGMDQLLQDSFSSGSSLMPSMKKNYDMEWTETRSGRVLTIIPKDPKQQLDINVQNNLVTIKGKIETKTAQGTSSSSFSNSFSVPEDCDASKVQMSQKNGSIVMAFPYSTAPAKKPIKGEVQI